MIDNSPPTLPHPTRKRKREVEMLVEGVRARGKPGRESTRVRPTLANPSTDDPLIGTRDAIPRTEKTP